MNNEILGFILRRHTLFVNSRRDFNAYFKVVPDQKCVLLQLMEVGIVIEGELLLLAHSLVVGSSAGSLRCILE